jgi:hypothetical protein
MGNACLLGGMRHVVRPQTGCRRYERTLRGCRQGLLLLWHGLGGMTQLCRLAAPNLRPLLCQRAVEGRRDLRGQTELADELGWRGL